MQPQQQSVEQFTYAEGEIPPESNDTATLAEVLEASVLHEQALHRDSIRAPAIGTKLADCPTNIDLTTARGKALAINAMSPAVLDISKKGQTKLKLRYFLIHPDKAKKRDTEEVTDVTRTVFIDKDGMTCRTTAPHAADFLQRLYESFTPEEWERGIPITIEYRPSRQPDRDYHAFSVDLDAM